MSLHLQIGRAVVVGLGAWVFPAWAGTTTFLSAEIFRAPREEVSKHTRLPPNHAGLESLTHGLWLAAQATLEQESEQPHAARRSWNEIEALCAEWRKKEFGDFLHDEVARASALCAMASAERTAEENFPLPWRPRAPFAEDFEAFQKIGLQEKERISITGQILARRSPYQGENLADALTLFSILEGTAPGTPSVSYWKGYTLYRRGSPSLAQPVFELASVQGDPRAALRLKRQRLGIVREPTFGFTAYPFYTPARGLGIGARLWDDRIGDVKRGYQLEAQASHRGNLLAGAQYVESELLEPATLELHWKGGIRKREYFGAGMAKTAAYQFSETGMDGELVVRTARYGWFQGFASGILRLASASGLPPFLRISPTHGFAYGVEWDGTDRLTSPRSGFKVSVRQEWLTAGASWFTRAEAQTRAYWLVDGKHRFSVGATLALAGDGAPLNARCELAAAGVPGVPEFRYQNVRCAAAWVSYQYAVRSWWGMGLFGSLGGVAAGFSKIPSALRSGIGLEAEFVFARNPSLAPRWELGVFNGEWVFQGGLRTLL